ncbi:unnamed protein product [Cochlearia groenlandica]
MAGVSRGESSNPYGGGLGNGGKFRKPTARKSQKTPYDRPPTSVRNTGIGGGEDRGGGWLSKLVDPAQRLITYSAHRLFASVFRKRLVSGETPLQSPLQSPEQPQQQQLPGRDGNASVYPTKDGFTDLEKLLKEKTFTRSEIDRLTTLLRSKSSDSSNVNGEQGNEASTVRHPQSHVMEKTHPNNASMNALVSTPLGSSRAIDECIASPAQLAKAYMGSRPSEVTPSMLGLRGQAVKEDSVFFNRTTFPAKSPTMSLVPKPSGQRPLENGFITPRSRGRSAIYSMARTPYSRPQSTVKVLILSPFGVVSETKYQHDFDSILQGLKRRISDLDNDIGSVGPVRRIRQKSNLSSRSLALPASESPLSVRGSGGQKFTHTSKDSAEDIPGSSFNLVPSKSSKMAAKIFQQLDTIVSAKETSPSKLSPSKLHHPALKSLQNVEASKFLDNLPEKKAFSPSSSYQKNESSKEKGSREVLALSEKRGGSADDTSKAGSIEDRVEGTYLPLKSSLEQHPPKKRAFRMTADEDFLELDDDRGEESTPFKVADKQDAFKVEKGVGISMPKEGKPLILSETMPSKSYIPNGDASNSTSNGSLETGKSKISALPIEAVQQSSLAFQPTSKFSQGTDKSSVSQEKLLSEEKVISREDPKKAAAVFPNFLSSPVATDSLNHNTGASADIKLEKTSSLAFGASEAFAKPTESKKTVSNSASGAESTTSAALTLNGSMFSGGAKGGPLDSSPSMPPRSDNSVSEVPFTVQSISATPAASSVFGKLPADTTGNDSSSQSTTAPPLSSSSPFKFGEPAAPYSASTGFASTVAKEAEAKNPTFGNINSFKFGGMTSADTSTGNVFAATSSENKSTPGFVFGSSSPAVADASKNIFGGTSSVVSSSTLNTSTAASSAPGGSGSLIFGATSSSTPGTETSKFSGISAATTGSNIFGTSSAFTGSGSSPFGGVAASTASSVFGFNAVSSASAASSQSQASNLFGTANSQMGNTVSVTTTTSTQSAPFQFGSSASAPSFGLSGNTSSSSSPFGLSKSEPTVFGSGSTPQLSSTTTSASSSGTASSSVFGSNWQAHSSAPVFSSSFAPSSSPTFSFGGSSAATGSTVSAPVFGASTNTSSSSPIFGFSSTAPTIPQQQPLFGNPAPSAAPSQSLFGNSTPGFAFGATAPPPNTNGFNNNQHMSMEDSMAEDTDQANKASSMVQQPMFGQPPASMPQQPFAFGGAPATPPPSGANPFQFGGQPMANTPQNASPFQASQSLEFQGGGSFSLGSTGGGDKSGRRIFKAKKTNRKR